jgi:hypothetical protein
MSNTNILEIIEKIKEKNDDTLKQIDEMKEIIKSLPQPPQPPQPPKKYKSHYDTAIELPLTLDNLNHKISCYNVLKHWIDNDKTNREKWEKDLNDETISKLEKLKIKISLKTSSLMTEWIENYNDLEKQLKQYELLYDTF